MLEKLKTDAESDEFAKIVDFAGVAESEERVLCKYFKTFKLFNN